jgi:hypothetical protein
MPALNLYDVFGDGVLERVPQGRVWGDARDYLPIP